MRQGGIKTFLQFEEEFGLTPKVDAMTRKEAGVLIIPEFCGGNSGNAACVPTSAHLLGSFGSITSSDPNYRPRDMQFALKLSF